MKRLVVHTPGYTLKVQLTQHRIGVDFALITVWPTSSTPEPRRPFNVTLDREGLTRLRDAFNEALEKKFD